MRLVIENGKLEILEDEVPGEDLPEHLRKYCRDTAELVELLDEVYLYGDGEGCGVRVLPIPEKPVYFRIVRQSQ